MKILTPKLRIVVALGFITTAANLSFGQETIPTATTTTVTSSGTVTEFTPNTIAIRVRDTPTPIRYTFTKTTTYVDENGNPVSVETVRSGAPVVVYYEKNGDQFLADKVVVQKTVTTTADPTSSSTTIVADTPAAPQQPAPIQQTQAVPPHVDGVIAEADSDDIAITTGGGSEGRTHYKAHDGTSYVDANGNPVSRHVLKEGTPVTIFYERDGDDMMATRVVVRNSLYIEKATSMTKQATDSCIVRSIDN